MITKISKGYQITIPAGVRHRFGLDIGTPIDIEERGREIVIKPVGKATKSSLNELFKESDKYVNNLTPEQLEEMEKDIYD
ncbi:AbrB/MazE/SpoVT family DNA-binding domain-containing protein [Candidatus Woesearchaeota archaeon]|nr:AbrB/MazE/SpoVT family DNA-binding domain-containing protein [Candidatus Woesearchaeota archaeon]